jgi:P27 family predicted phage terminase small subunit
LGYRGPIPKPTAIEIAEGRPGKRRLNGREPQPRGITPKCPAYLDERARQEWRRLILILKQMKVLTEADGLMLGNLCLTVSTLVKAQEKLNQLGILYKSPSGYVMQSPLLTVVNQCVDTITKLSREFGLTPASRPRLTIEKQDDGDELMALLSLPRPKPVGN